MHIADVSHFVTENSSLDKEGRLRTTSVYLVHRVIPMLPELISNNLCSLNPGEKKLAFSVFFKINENGEIINNEKDNVRYGKSIIKSFAKLSYDVV